MAKIAHAELPKVTKSTRQRLDPKVLKGVLADLQGSFDFSPHAYTDGQEYETYSDALSVLNLTKRSIAEANGMPANMIAGKTWDATGNKDRKKAGKWMFAVSQRSTSPKPRAPRKPRVPATA